MTQTERRRFLLSRLLAEAPKYRQLAVPDDAAGQKQLLRPGCQPGVFAGAGRIPARRACPEGRYRP